MTSTANLDATLANVTFVGPLWSGDLLAAVRDNTLPKDLKRTVSAASYGLPKTADPEDTARAAWTLLRAAWAEFSATHADRVAANGGDPDYGSDDFTRPEWTTHLLTALGYHPTPTPTGGLVADNAEPRDDGNHDRADRYQITDVHDGQVPVHVVPAGTPLHKRTSGVTGASYRSPHGTVQEWLNRSDAHLWAVLTNGLTLRLLRDNAAMARQAYVEFDLAAIFTEGDYPTFALMWRTVHATRFTHKADAQPTDCVAEQWQTHNDKAGVAALDDLRSGVENALHLIGQGLVRHPRNGALRDALADPDDPFDAAAFYRELLYVVYQHVFWFVVDDRNLLHPADTDADTVDLYRTAYSSDVLRSKARRHRAGQQPDAWHHYRLVTSWFGDADGQPELGIPALLGGLWDSQSTAHLHGTTLDNRTYYEAVRSLSYVRRDNVLRRINYDVLGSEELGAVYEGLLENVPDVDVPTRTFTLDKTAGNDRKTTGSYYTPTSLINVLLDEALDPVVQQVMADAKQEAIAAGASPDGIVQAQVDAIVGNPTTGTRPLTVCDPAMGSAHFLVAAGWRLALHVAQLRTGQSDPPHLDVQQALRDAASRCLYGVDINPMAVELAKVAVWLETHVPGQPLTFLDHHFKCGNGLLGVGFDPSLIAWHTGADPKDPVAQGGVPDHGKSTAKGRERDACDALAGLSGDSKKAVAALKRRNRERRIGQLTLDMSADWHDDPTAHLAAESRIVGFADDTTPEGLAAKADAWMVYGTKDRLLREKLRADAWTACWVMPKTDEQAARDDQPFDVYYDSHYNGLPGDKRPGVVQTRQLAAELRFFHWYVEYPEVAEAGGFDVMLGNPPWEVLSLRDDEWFAAMGRPEMAQKGADANDVLTGLRISEDESDIRLADLYEAALSTLERLKHFLKSSGRFNYGAVGDVDLYAVFTELFWKLRRRSTGRAGMVIREQLAVGKFIAPFFQRLVQDGELASFYTFENEELVFPTVHHSMGFALCVLAPPDRSRPVSMTGHVRSVSDLAHPERRYNLTPGQIESINPNTLNAPLFRNSKAAEVLSVLHRAGVLLDRSGPQDVNHWSVRNVPLFHMKNDASVFWSAVDDPVTQLERRGEVIDVEMELGVAQGKDGTQYIPLVEGKTFWHFDHRYATYAGVTEANRRQGVGRHSTDHEKHSPNFVATPQYWVELADVTAKFGHRWEGEWVWAFRDVGPSERTFVPSVLPRRPTATQNNSPMLVSDSDAVALIYAMLASLPFDYAMRQKHQRMALFRVEQGPILRPGTESDVCPWNDRVTVDEFVTPRVGELTFTAYDLSGWAAAIGVVGEPFRWDADRRPVLQAELDAAMFHLYGLDREQVEFVLDSFDVLRKYEEKPPEKGGYSEFRTKRLVLERYDAMTNTAASGEPYECPLDVPPAHDSLRHHAKES